MDGRRPRERREHEGETRHGLRIRGQRHADRDRRPPRSPSASTRLPIHTGKRIRTRRSKAFRSIRPACAAQWRGERGVGLHPGEQAARTRAPAGRSRPRPRPPRSGRTPRGAPRDRMGAAPRFTRMLALGCSFGRAPGRTKAARNGHGTRGGDHLEEHDPGAAGPLGSRVRPDDPRRPLPRGRSYRRRRDGRGLPRARRRPRPAGRDQGPAPEPVRRLRLRRAVPPRGSRRREPDPSEHRGRPRLGRRRRHLLHGDGVRRAAGACARC